MPIKWQPFKGQEGPAQLPDVFDEEGPMMPFPPIYQTEEPAMDVYQDKKNLYLEVFLGGIKPENIEVFIKNNILTIQGKSEVKEETKEKDYLRKEIKKGSFRRIVKLPVDVQDKKASAEVVNGLLKITMPKASETDSKASKVPIKIRK